MNLSMFNFLTAAAGTEAATEIAEKTPLQTFLSGAMTFLPLILIAVAFYFFLIRPQKKQEKEAKAMRESIGMGDKITTIGGITGIVRQVKDDEFVIETGAEKNKITVKKWAVQTKDTVSDAQ